METLAIISGTAYWYYIVAAVLIVGAVVVIMIHYRRNREYLRTFHSKENQISELKSKLADLESTIHAESERSAKAIHENTSGIRYARRIQSAAFPQKEIGDIFNDYFIFTKPHTIVSGDFYKAVQIKHYKIFALADCSGHGVPGAFLTMLGLSALKESLAKHFYDDNIDLAAILDEMRQFVKTSLRSTEDSDAPVNDGMNLTLCAFADNDSGIRFAGANQNVYLYSDGAIVAYNGDRMPIGWSFKGDNPFTETLIPAHKGDMLYLTTDSLPSQFGGPDNVKFSTKRLAAMFEEIASLSTEEQKNTISEVVTNWVEGHVQVDDLTVAGVRV